MRSEGTLLTDDPVEQDPGLADSETRESKDDTVGHVETSGGLTGSWPSKSQTTDLRTPSFSCRSLACDFSKLILDDFTHRSL